MRFKKGNNFKYGQDFGFFVGVPCGIDFELFPMGTINGMSTEKIVLRGPGHGGKPYGNGAIYLRVKSIDSDKDRQAVLDALYKDMRTRDNAKDRRFLNEIGCGLPQLG